MSSHRTKSMILAVAALGLATPILAQSRSAVTTAELEAAVTVPANGNRQTVRDFLARPEVQSVAGRMGVRASELSAAVATLDSASVDRIARQATANDRQLAGGANHTIVISTTAIIIGLLILILLVD